MEDGWHGMAHRGIVEINREGFEEIEIDPSSSLVSTRLC